MKIHYSEVNDLWYIMCPACKVTHAFGHGHGFDGNMESPTITGSLGWKGEASDGIERYCHSQVANGNITFISDSKHEFAGQTLNLPDL